MFQKSLKATIPCTRSQPSVYLWIALVALEDNLKIVILKLRQLNISLYRPDSDEPLQGNINMTVGGAGDFSSFSAEVFPEVDIQISKVITRPLKVETSTNSTSYLTQSSRAGALERLERFSSCYADVVICQGCLQCLYISCHCTDTARCTGQPALAWPSLLGRAGPCQADLLIPAKCI